MTLLNFRMVIIFSGWRMGAGEERLWVRRTGPTGKFPIEVILAITLEVYLTAPLAVPVADLVSNIFPRIFGE